MYSGRSGAGEKAMDGAGLEARLKRMPLDGAPPEPAAAGLGPAGPAGPGVVAPAMSGEKSVGPRRSPPMPPMRSRSIDAACACCGGAPAPAVAAPVSYVINAAAMTAPAAAPDTRGAPDDGGLRTELKDTGDDRERPTSLSRSRSRSRSRTTEELMMVGLVAWDPTTDDWSRRLSWPRPPAASAPPAPRRSRGPRRSSRHRPSSWVSRRNVHTRSSATARTV